MVSVYLLWTNYIRSYMYSTIGFVLDSVKDQMELTSFKKLGESIIEECKEPNEDNNEIEIKSITEEGRVVIVSESNDAAVTVKE